MPSVVDRIRKLWEAGRALFPERPTVNHKTIQELSWKVYRDPAALENDSHYYHFSALALAFWERYFTHTVEPEIASHLQASPLKSEPRKQPRLFNGPWLMEVREPSIGQRLFGDTVALGAYFEPTIPGWALIGWRTTFGPLSSQTIWWFPEWKGDLVQELEVDNLRYEWRDGCWAASVEPADNSSPWAASDAQWANQAVQFAMQFAIMLDARHAPIRVRDIGTPPLKPRDIKQGKGEPSPWLVRYVYPLDPPEKKHSKSTEPREPFSDHQGYVLSPVEVRGHYRLQPCGEGRRETEYIFIEDYEAHRWTSTTPVKVVVGKKKEKSKKGQR